MVVEDGPLNVERSFADLATLAEGAEELCVRVHRVDGTTVEGTIHGIGFDLLLLEEGSKNYVRVLPHEMRSVDVKQPRRAREWALALLALPVATVFLVGFSRLPGVRPEISHITVGFILLCAIVWGILAIPAPRNLVRAWVTRWERIYPSAS